LRGLQVGTVLSATGKVVEKAVLRLAAKYMIPRSLSGRGQGEPIIEIDNP